MSGAATVHVLERARAENTVGGYRLLRVLGRGGMSTVYEAEQTKLRRCVALKLLHPSPHLLRNDPCCVKRFLREASCSAALRGPHAVAVFDYGAAQHRGETVWYLAMERLEGHTLRQIVRRAGCIAPHRVLRLALQMASALQEAHREGILHRDLKPANVFLQNRLFDGEVEHVKVLDFGLAKNLLEHDDEELTRHGILLGSPHYMPPEQIRGEPLSFSSDVYSLGAVLYEMLTGRPPFVGDDHVRVLMDHIERAPTPLLERVPTVPAGLAHLVHACLAKDPAQRPRSMEALATSLRVLLEESPNRTPLFASDVGGLPSLHGVASLPGVPWGDDEPTRIEGSSSGASNPISGLQPRQPARPYLTPRRMPLPSTYPPAAPFRAAPPPQSAPPLPRAHAWSSSRFLAGLLVGVALVIAALAVSRDRRSTAAADASIGTEAAAESAVQPDDPPRRP